MVDGVRASIRAARRSDLHTLADLRMHFLGEAANGEPRLRLMPDARVRIEQILPVWMGLDERVLLVGVSGVAAADDAGQPIAYASGLLRHAPPIFEHQQVGEILEVFVAEAHRGRGLGAALVEVLTEALVGRGAQVLRTAVPMAHAKAQARFEQAGFAPLGVELERRLDRG
jgi:GNAT superfamily N-acetyltransferase